jgi:uncharacterized protein YkwD
LTSGRDDFGTAADDHRAEEQTPMPRQMQEAGPHGTTRVRPRGGRLGWRGGLLALHVLLGALVAQSPGIAAAADSAAAPVEAARPAPAPTALELELFARVNADRAAHGLPPVALDAAALAVARARAADQLPLPALSHHDAAGDLVFVRLLGEAGVAYELAGENLARVTDSAAAAAEHAEHALMDSPTHRANILDPSFDQLAVGVATSSSGHVVFAQIFRHAG